MTINDARNCWKVFGVAGSVGRFEYATTGVLLMLVKYGVEAGVILAATGFAYTPLDFCDPRLIRREHFAEPAAPWLGIAWLVWTVPFVWIAVAMTLRRARDVGATPWFCLLILVPILNFATMLTLALAPSQERRSAEGQETEEQRLIRQAWIAPQADLSPPADDRPESRGSSPLLAALAGLAVGVGYTLALMVLSVYGFGSYGAALFFGAPIVSGAAAAYVYNRPTPRTLGATLAHSLLMVVCSSAAFLLVGLEGAICIVMAVPILGPLAIAGAVIGRAIAVGVKRIDRRDDHGLIGCLVVLPIVAGVEPMVSQPLPLVVETSVVIAAPPSSVWETVVAFPEIETAPDWFFRWGIAAPVRARIDGVGVGAVRRCEFTTGAFVEPITVWDEPRRLAFNVSEQPEPMFELTPYHHLHPPHLTGSFRSTRGEFVLQPTAGGGTRLVGRTWYTLDIAPHSYWRWWTNAIVHRIHLRVLQHIRRVSEQ